MKIWDVREKYAHVNFNRVKFIRAYRTLKRDLYKTLFREGRDKTVADDKYVSTFLLGLETCNETCNETFNRSMITPQRLAEVAAYNVVHLELLNKTDEKREREGERAFENSLNVLRSQNLTNGHFIGTLAHSFMKKLITDGLIDDANKFSQYLNENK